MLLIGRSTRSRYVTDLDKAYTATARFGAVSDTLDADGNITSLDALCPTKRHPLHSPSFTGELLQVPRWPQPSKARASVSTTCTAAASPSSANPAP